MSVLSVLSVLACGADETASDRAGLQVAADSVRALAERFIEADSRKDVDGVLALFTRDPDLTIVSVGVLRPSLESFGNALRSNYAALRSLDIKLDSARATALSPTAALLVASYHYRRVDTAGATMSGQAVITYLGEDRNGRWEIVHYHFSRAAGPVVPSDN